MSVSHRRRCGISSWPGWKAHARKPVADEHPAWCSSGQPRLRRQHFHHHESDIIHRLDVTAEGGQALADRAHDLIRRARGTVADYFAQSILAVLLALRV